MSKPVIHAKGSKPRIFFPGGLFQPLSLLSKPWTHITIDFIEGLPTSRAFNCLLVVVDCLIKYRHFTPLSHPYTTSFLAQLFIQNIFKYHGMPNSNVFDRDKTFTSKFWRKMFKHQGVDLAFSTTYHSQINGQFEVINKVLKNYLKCFVGERPKDWALWISLAEWWYNTTTHASTQMTSFEAFYSYLPHKLLSYTLNASQVEAVGLTLRNREHIQQLLK